MIDLDVFMDQNKDKCIYEMDGNKQHVEVVEYAPQIFAKLREKFGVKNTFLFESFVPVHNV